MAAAPNPFDELQKRKAEEARKEPESKRDAKTELALAAVKFQKRVRCMGVSCWHGGVTATALHTPAGRGHAGRAQELLGRLEVCRCMRVL